MSQRVLPTHLLAVQFVHTAPGPPGLYVSAGQSAHVLPLPPTRPQPSAQPHAELLLSGGATRLPAHWVHFTMWPPGLVEFALHL